MDSKNTNKKIYVSPVLEAVEADKTVSLGMVSITTHYGQDYTVSIGGVDYNTADYYDADGVFNKTRLTGIWEAALDALFDQIEDEDGELDMQAYATYKAAKKERNAAVTQLNEWLGDNVSRAASADASAFGASDAWGEASSPFGN